MAAPDPAARGLVPTGRACLFSLLDVAAEFGAWLREQAPGRASAPTPAERPPAGGGARALPGETAHDPG